MEFQGDQDDYVGDEEHGKNKQAHAPCVSCHHHSQPVGVAAGKFQQWEEIIHEVINEVHGENNLYSGTQDPPSPDHHHQELAEPLLHDGHVVQRLSDDHIVVMGHDGEDGDLWSRPEMFHKELS